VRAADVATASIGDAPAHWLAVAEAPLLIAVGVTGVGKSTTLERLERAVRCRFLPDRRELADRVVLPWAQDALGERRCAVRDRVERFRLTAEYRRRNPGGLAHALSLLRVDPAALDALLVFDGLRGAEELAWAIDHLPRSRFLALHAPEAVRLLRLLGRAESFDQAELTTAVSPTAPRDAAGLLRSVPGLDSVLGRGEAERLLRSPALDGVPLDEIARKASILVEEARNYDPRAAVRLLEEKLGPDRRLVVDTAAHDPDDVVDQVTRWLRSAA
jgi:hypothetical protein